MKEANEVNAGKLAAVWRKIHDKRAELAAAFAEEDNQLKEAQETLEAEMLEKCKEEEADSIKTPYGTIIRSIKTRYWPADWEVFNRFMLDNEAPELFEKRVHQTNMAQWIEEHPNNIPVGLNIDRKYACTVRKAVK